MGFADPARAEPMLLADLGMTAAELRTDPLVTAIAAAGDPDLALAGLARLFGAAAGRDDLRAALRGEQDFRDRLTAVLGVSAGLADHLARHPEDAAILRGAITRPQAADLRADLLRAVGADPGDADSADPDGPVAAAREPTAALAAAYRRRLLHLAARDLTGAATVDEVGEELADIAAAVLEAALAVARAELAPGAAPCRLAVVAMGKCGGYELNYASDVDVIFVAEPVKDEDETAALATASRLAAGLIGVCARSTPEGSIFPVDPNLRPEGRAGPLVRTLASHLAYYERWAKTWEFQALLKARPVAGDMPLGQAYADTFGPLVWQAARREHFVEDVQAMRRRVEQSLPARQAGRELKLGPGGLRDIEFAVQLLQLVHGRIDETLRSPATLPALAALAAGGYVGRADADELGAAYRFLRRTEHLLQLNRLSRTHTLPEDPAVLRRLGRAMRFNDGPNEPWFQSSVTGIRSDPAADFDEEWRRHARQVRRLHEKLFYRPLLDAVARLPSEAARLTPAEARARLEALGYVDPAGALHHIDALTSGVSRRAAIQRTLLPVLLGWFADAAEPDAGLLAFRQVSEALGSSPWYLRLLRDETKAAERMAHVLASSRYAAGLLLRAPEAVAIFGNDAELKPRSLTGLRAEMMAAIQRYEDDAEAAVTAVRSVRRRELLRTAAADVLGFTGPSGPSLAVTGEALTSVTRASLQAALAVALRKVSAELRRPLPTRFAVIAMGRFGGHECGYGSDADVLFVHDPLPGRPEKEASDTAHAVAAVPEAERPAVQRALAKNPNERWPSCAAFVRGLIDPDSDTLPIQTRRRQGILVVGLLLLSVLATVGVLIACWPSKQPSSATERAMVQTMVPTFPDRPVPTASLTPPSTKRETTQKEPPHQPAPSTWRSSPPSTKREATQKEPVATPRDKERSTKHYAFVFDGKSRIVTSVDRFAPCTLEAWVRPEAVTGGRVERQVIGSDIPGLSGIGLGMAYLQAAKPVLGAQILPVPVSRDVPTSQVLPIRAWSHVAAVFRKREHVCLLQRPRGGPGSEVGQSGRNSIRGGQRGQDESGTLLCWPDAGRASVAR